MRPLAVVLLCVLAACAGPDLAVLDGRGFDDRTELLEALDDAVVCIPGGPGAMGDAAGGADEMPARTVTLDGFCIGRFEVTNLEYERFVVQTGARRPSYWEQGSVPDGLAALPVVGVDWWDAAGFCTWAGGRLPTEAEWERACAGAEGRSYPWGEEWVRGRANVAPAELDREDGWRGASGTKVDGVRLRPVGSIPAGSTADGIHDLCGNAAEWVADWYDPDAYGVLPDTNPVAGGPQWSHVVRGAAWYVPGGGEAADAARCSARDASHADESPRLGFRCAFDARP